MPMKENKLLQSMRNAALNRDWEVCQETCRILLQQLDCINCLQLALYLVEGFAQQFCDYYPDESWVSIRSKQLKIVTVSGFEDHWPARLPESKNEYSSPGSTEFVHAFERLWRIPLAWHKNDSQRCAWLTESVISEIFAANLIEKWGRTQPAQWQQVRHEYYIVNENFRDYVSESEQLVNLWLELVNELGERLPEADHSDE